MTLLGISQGAIPYGLHVNEDYRLMTAASRAVGLMRGVGHDSPICDDDCEQVLRQMRSLLRDEAERLSEAVDLFVKKCAR